MGHPESLVKLVGGVPGATVSAILSNVPVPTVIEIVNTLDSAVLVEIIAGSPADQTAGILQQVASGCLKMNDLVQICRGLPPRVVTELLQSIPSAINAKFINGIDTFTLLFILGKV